MYYLHEHKRLRYFFIKKLGFNLKNHYFCPMQTSKYMVVNERDSHWGLTVSTVGYEEIAPGDSYPTRGHADGYYFSLDKGRELNEYQLLYLTEGEGTFKSAHIKETSIKEGDLFLLFPGEWHSYHPLNNVGWKSYWIGFKGINMDMRINNGFLTHEKAIYHVGFSEDIVRLYRSAYDTAMKEAAYSQQLLAGIVNHLIGMMYSLERNIILSKDQSHVDMVNRAQLRIREELESSLTIQQIAQDLGVSYSNFRKLFKEYTGISPALYQQDLKLQRAKELLSTTDLSIKEIAYQLNFESPDYFSAKFKIKTGRKPSELRGGSR
jgi:AraC-like DNA-binding protein